MNSIIFNDVEPKKIGFSAPDSHKSENRKFAFGNTLSELIDSVTSIKDVDFTIDFISTYNHLLSLEDLKRLEKFILKFDNIYQALRFVRLVESNKNIESYDYSSIEKIFLSADSIHYKIALAHYASKEYFLKVQKEVINSKNADAIYTFAKDFIDCEKSSYNLDVDALYQSIKDTCKKHSIAIFEINILKRKPTILERFYYL